MSISVLSINSRGIRNDLKRKGVFLFCQGKSADFYFIQETHAEKSDSLFWKNQWGKDIWFSYGTNKSAGVAVLKGNFKGEIIKYLSDDKGRWIMLLLNTDNSQFILVNIYATNNKKENINLFLAIEDAINGWLSTFPLAKVIWGGDFNTVMNDEIDRFPTKNKGAANELDNVCNRLNLIDIWRHKHPNDKMYTWSNKDKSLQSRIDFWLVSASTTDNVERTDIEPSIFTDHKAVSIRINLSKRPKINTSLTQIK